ncbi:tripartite ATP-independent transporter solute receptor, DctP family [Tistlia consotensis]|uniref:Tripartite ATP-independent transporter solute receptor, DctP family n=1 Tax=Tistlia consotensis USBA 355 TaxID=560819 RepID=A0A1Y6CN45_9PROT|nr:C4-dicarboxylate TRAP transporter substrate-binding protein [Tistlia consotensis]SMF76496.1 tripartite ATP-independent transporter solute receptor, DctP family [Tistlia consotensis USBA 355]SNS13084.1 tripartite ATP-independent transporter solute receptor, DctP family [Tistlia consotensis]
MKTPRFVPRALLALVAVAAATGSVPAPRAEAASHTLRLGTVLAPGDPLVAAAEGMKKAVEARTKGDVEIQIYPSSQIGDTQDMIDQAAAGSNVGTFVEASRVAVYVPEFNVLVAPYVFDDVDQIVRFSETPTFAEWNRKLEQKSGLTLLSFNWYQGARELLTQKPVATPADLKGVRIRTIGEPLWIKTIGAMGATATPLAWAEVYPSIQTGVIEGAEAQPSAIWGAKLYEVVKDITLTDHIYLMSGLLVSAEWLKSLPEDEREIVVEEANRWGASALKHNVEGAAAIFAKIRATGVKVTEIDKTPFRKAVEPVYGELGLTDLIAQVRKTLGN